MSHSTIRDVARVAGVSLGTVSNFLNENKPVAEDTSKRIEAAIALLDFVPNSAVRVIHGHRSHVIAFIVPDGGNPFFGEVERGIEDVAVAQSHVIVSCNTQGDPAREQQYAKALAEMRVRAAIAVASPTSDRLLAAVSKTGARGVTLGHTSDETFSSIIMDDHLGGLLAMRHVLSLGRRRPAFLGGPAGELQIGEREGGMRAALVEAGLPASTLRRVDAEGTSTSDRPRAARKVLDLDPPPDAVLCANDMLALALETEALRAGIKIPNELAIVGYDDVEAAQTAVVPITTIHQPQYELGRRAAELAFADEGDTATTLRFQPTLIERESTIPRTA